MINFIKDAFTKLLRDTADKIDADNCEINEEQAIEIMKLIAHQPMSKEGVAIYLHMSTSRFDTLVREHKFPKGRKRLGFREKVWFKDEIDECVKPLTT